jgi:hypothetical protein
MCKYNSYAVEIVHLNGNRQLREAEDNTSYNSTIALYHDIKEDYMDKDVTINFLGYTENDEQGIIFTKKNTIINNERKNIETLVKTIYESSKELQELYRIIADKEGYYDKKKSNIDHLFIEAVDTNELTTEDKAKIFDEIREINLLRRDYKILNEIRRNTHVDINTIVQRAENILNKYKNNISKNNKTLKSLINRDKKSISVHLIEEVPYTSQKERVLLIKKLKKQYDRIVQIPEREVIACYNKCKSV